MSVFKKSTLICAGFAALSFSVMNAASAQSLPVPMPIEEQRELEDARLRQKTDEEYAGRTLTFTQGVPLGRSSVASSQINPISRSNTPQLQTLPSNASGYTIKAGSFQSFENAQKLHAKLYAIGSSKIIPRRANGKDFYGVYLGPWATEAEAFQAFTLAMDAGMQDGQILDPQ
ncbi:SPOR domain-containing protein [Hirschia baltica]|uniref:Sporulation domain protein n=1 Tax=Hirschia baltica (strain ATCC 49814 / DSM 5838 / IFAM 1418) TaxID=582402 RepID=C6XMB5_HIRBI|nr:SPOR domain-containing protein [Hirschia baltica]ACT58058.1 Sporulation domain protein [Hirschia baltica ATCC 49814]